jgi:hypothetical protein
MTVLLILPQVRVMFPLVKLYLHGVELGPFDFEFQPRPCFLAFSKIKCLFNKEISKEKDEIPLKLQFSVDHLNFSEL